MRSLWMLTAVFLAAGSVPAHAQFLEDFEERLWGVQVSFTPEWQSLDLSGGVLKLEEFDISGSDYAIGFARGRMSSGHWGVSLVRQRWQEMTICTNAECYESTPTTRLQGIAGNWFLPFGSPFAGDRLQAGMHVDLGAGWLDGTVREIYTSADGAAVPAGEEVAVAELFSAPWDKVPLPLFRAEVAVAVTVAPGFKVIGSGGYGFPFKRRIGISVAYFPMAGRN